MSDLNSDHKSNDIHIENSTVAAVGDHNNVTQNLYVRELPDYQRLTDQIKKSENKLKDIENDIESDKSDLQHLPEPNKSNKEKRISEKEKEKSNIYQELDQFKDELNQFLEGFKLLDKQVSEAAINSSNEWIKQAKAHLERGEIQEFDAIFDKSEMQKELNKLNDKRQQINLEEETLGQKFLIAALREAIKYNEPNRIETTCKIFENALEASRTAKILFQYALFLEKNKRYDQAVLLYQEAKEVLEQNPNKDLHFLFSIMNNLANVYLAQNKLEEAEVTFKKVLEITEKLAQDKPDEYLRLLIIALNNLANVYSDQNKVDKAIDIYQQLLKKEKELDKKTPKDYQYRAIILYNLADLHLSKNEFDQAIEDEYQEALQIIKEIREKLDPKKKHIYDFPFAAFHVKILNSLADFHSRKNEFDTAIDECKKALQIAEELVQKNPNYQKLVADTRCKLSDLYHYQNQFNKALDEYEYLPKEQK